MKLHHIGYLVKDMSKAISIFLDLGYEVDVPSQYDKYRKINICFLKNESTIIELIESVTEDSIVSGLLKKSGPTPYHICYLVPNLEETISILQKKHFFVTSNAMPAPVLNDRLVAFLYHNQIGLIELLEEEN